MTMRAMDDVKESCRAAAATTMHTLQSVTLRLADPAATAAEDAAKAMNMMLPFLLTKCRSPPSSCHHMRTRSRPHSVPLISGASKGSGPTFCLQARRVMRRRSRQFA